MASSSPRSTASGVRSSCEISAIKSRRICWFFLQRTGELVKILRQLAQLILAARVHAGGKIPGGQFMRAFHQPFHRGEQARASGKVASAASSVERMTISQLARRC
ncbi:Uncharacterised protein [Enterobacter cloacae]|uniref:Uncharacterized protein n=1 Tax=Enterobacter cloacae TaxID=550 RepID=A0A377LYX2_ENTCL|nr:Uncharacterised protein [Enterobacter cloacae]